ncbi:alpha/beta fold hydrolase [Flexivirga caeni]|uniref:Alpha/beta fold hydrolase n=1 Tax=Flexivirga caeni TaxID=2294115 RepID=A0A3M9MBB9_9MICO|nr:alpha/beta fold hydrolase [Flexivirga caeni]RNI22872.1 alpha/beta fold hydrolase [Flexivirga caeni]
MKASRRVRFVDVHGHRRAYVLTGHGPALLLHGVACDHTTWDRVIRPLSRDYTVIAPDLLGHGQSAKPRADYTLGGFANGMRDLLSLLEIERATIVGHSFGGGVAMQFAYQFPELTERLVLVAPGGLGPEVSPIIRAATLPGFEQVMGVLTLPGIRQVNTVGLRIAHAARLPGTRDIDEIATVYDSFRDPQTRAAAHHVLRAVVDRHGQVVTMTDRAYLTESMPLCVIWGAEDPIIPASQADTVAELAPGARVEIVEDSGHFPHRDHPEEFLRIVRDFLASTRPSAYDRERLRHLLRTGAQRPVRRARAGQRPVAPLTG